MEGGGNSGDGGRERVKWSGKGVRRRRGKGKSRRDREDRRKRIGEKVKKWSMFKRGEGKEEGGRALWSKMKKKNKIAI